MQKKQLIAGIALGAVICLAGCETWPIAAAREAKQRTSETGPVVGEIEEAAGVDDPLGRQQGSVEDTEDKLDSKVDKVDNTIENVADDM